MNIKNGKIFADSMFGGIYSVFYNPEAKNPIPEKFELVSLYPNPFNPTLTIQYNLDSKQNVSIDIYNAIEILPQCALPVHFSLLNISNPKIVGTQLELQFSNYSQFSKQ